MTRWMGAVGLSSLLAFAMPMVRSHADTGCPAAPNTSVQFNASGVCGGTDQFTWDGSEVIVGNADSPYATLIGPNFHYLAETDGGGHIIQFASSGGGTANAPTASGDHDFLGGLWWSGTNASNANSITAELIVTGDGHVDSSTVAARAELAVRQQDGTLATATLLDSDGGSKFPSVAVGSLQASGPATLKAVCVNTASGQLVVCP